MEVFPDAEGIYASRVLPGLQFPARWLINPPDPDWAAEQLGLMITPETLEAERSRADTEQARAERLAARLRALGIDPDAQ